MSRKILIIDDHDDLASKLKEVFTTAGYTVKKIEDCSEETLQLKKKESFDIVVFDLDVPENTTDSINKRSNTRVFKILAENYNLESFDETELRYIFETILNHKAQIVDRETQVRYVREKIEFAFPSALSLIHSILSYLAERVEKIGVINAEKSDLFIALDEAFINAIKHGNKFDNTKLVRIKADISTAEVRFTVEDEGEGFDVKAVPDPTTEENLLKPSGRGVLIIKKLMDEVSYNEKGNRLEMVKRFEK